MPPEPAKSACACDRCALIALYSAYNRAIDAGDAAAWAQTFTDDGAFEHPSRHFVGRVALEQFITQRAAKLGSHPCSHQRHWNDGIELHVNGARALGNCRLLLSGMHRDTGRTEVVTTGRYSDELVKDDLGWRFCRRHLQVD